MRFGHNGMSVESIFVKYTKPNENCTIKAKIRKQKWTLQYSSFPLHHSILWFFIRFAFQFFSFSTVFCIFWSNINDSSNSSSMRWLSCGDKRSHRSSSFLIYLFFSTDIAVSFFNTLSLYLFILFAIFFLSVYTSAEKNCAFSM